MSNPVRQVNAAWAEGSDGVLRSGANDVPRQGLWREKCVHKANNAAVADGDQVAGAVHCSWLILLVFCSLGMIIQCRDCPSDC